MKGKLLVPAVLLASVLLAGCTAVSPEEGDASTSTSTPTRAPSFPMPDLGPVPPYDTYTPEEEEQARLASVEENWATVVSQFPDAVRPDVAFEHYVQGEDAWMVGRDCVESLGVETAPPNLASGEPASGYQVVFDRRDPLPDMISVYSCQVRYPYRPVTPFTSAQVGYLYDYFTEYYIPCLQHEGFEVSAAETTPTREFFVENWPNQQWYPSPDIEPLDSPDGDLAESLCPSQAFDER